MAARSTTKTAHHKHGCALAPVYRYFTEVLRLVGMGYPGAHGVKCGKSVSCLGSPGLGERVLRGKRGGEVFNCRRPSCHVWCWRNFASWNVNLFNSIILTDSTGTNPLVTSLEERALVMRQATFQKTTPGARYKHKNMRQVP